MSHAAAFIAGIGLSVTVGAASLGMVSAAVVAGIATTICLAFALVWD